MKLKLWQFALGLAAAFALVPALSGAGRAQSEGLGVFPSVVEVEEGLRGAEYFRSIGVINDSDDEKTWLLSSAGVPRDWVSFWDVTNHAVAVDRVVTGPNEETQIAVRIQLPQDTANGSYAGLIRVLAEGSGTIDDPASDVDLGAEVLLSVEVTGTQRLAGDLVDFAADDVEAGFPLRLATTIRNTGNVNVSPEIGLEVIDATGTVRGSAVFKDRGVPAGGAESLSHAWDTSQIEIGDYTARVSVSFGELSLGTREDAFKLLPAGSLVRSGELQSLTLLNDPAPGEVAKFKATFVNTGDVAVGAEFAGELYAGDRLDEAVGSQELMAEPGVPVELEVLAPVEKAGEYTLKGAVNYEGQPTGAMEVEFTVDERKGLPSWAIPVGAALLGLVGGALIFAGSSRWRSSMQRKESQEEVTQ
jgi:hypothetical protein